MRQWKSKKIDGRPLVGIAVATFLGGNDADRRVHQLASLLHALAAQTWSRWRAIVVHDGPDPGGRAQAVLAAFDDPRATLVVTDVREGRHRHRWRRETALSTGGDYLGMMNDDGWYAPVYFEALLSKLSATAPLAYCNCVHSHKMWAPLQTAPRTGSIDVGGWLAARQLVPRTPWPGEDFNADGRYVEAMVAAARPLKAVKVESTLFVHN